MLIATWIITFVLIVGLGVYAGTKIANASQWSGADRSMGIFAVGAMLGAWQIGGMSIVGAAQNGYVMGIAGSWYSIANGLYILAIGILAKQMRRNFPSDALPDYLENRYSTRVARLQSYVWIVFGLMYIPIQLKTVASILQIVLPGLNTHLCMFIGVTIAVAYTAFAGMKGASIVGRVVCVATYILLAWFIFANLGDFGGYSGLVSMLPEGYDQMSAMPTQQVVAWMIGGILTSIVLQSALQPVLAAKSDKAATWGCVLGYVIAGPICILTAIIGMMARAKTPDLGDGATAFAWAIKDMSSPVMAGIIFAVMTMIIAATLATMMMATGTIVTNVYKKQINPKADDKAVLKVSRWGTVAVAYLSLLLGFFIPSAQMTNMFLTVNYVVTAPFSFSVLAGLFWKKANAKGSFFSIIAGIVVALGWVAAGLNGKINVVYPTIIICYVVGIIVSLATNKSKEAA
ncbi:MAG: sodium:solute symporter family protein [Pygmaiobacter massiliensis]|nr:sodium:solute symporter family protein [Pygmaiobacter massiliensis]